MEIKNAIFQDLESFDKRLFKLTMEKYWIFVWENPTKHKIEKT